MLPVPFVLPLAQNFVSPPNAGLGSASLPADAVLPFALLALGLLAVLVLLLRRRSRVPPDPRPAILIDGSNVMHWQDNTPNVAPLQKLVRDLTLRGMNPGVVFDANVGYKLTGRFLNERDLAKLLMLPSEHILVVPKGTQADYYLLETARDLKAQIVTNDRFRDWAETYPEVSTPGTLLRGGMRNGQVWYDDPAEAPKATASPMA
jgi:hypothetical protein